MKDPYTEAEIARASRPMSRFTVTEVLTFVLVSLGVWKILEFFFYGY